MKHFYSYPTYSTHCKAGLSHRSFIAALEPGKWGGGSFWHGRIETGGKQNFLPYIQVNLFTKCARSKSLLFPALQASQKEGGSYQRHMDWLVYMKHRSTKTVGKKT